MLKPILILCLGNEIISDDGFGPEVAKRLMQQDDLPELVEVIFAPLAGFNLIDLLAGRDRVLIVDTVRTGHSPPGTLHQFDPDAFAPTRNLTTSHQISLPTALELGRQMGAKMPDLVEVLGVEAEDLATLREGLSPRVQVAVDEALLQIRTWVYQNMVEKHHDA